MNKKKPGLTHFLKKVYIRSFMTDNLFDLFVEKIVLSFAKEDGNGPLKSL